MIQKVKEYMRQKEKRKTKRLKRKTKRVKKVKRVKKKKLLNAIHHCVASDGQRDGKIR